MGRKRQAFAANVGDHFAESVIRYASGMSDQVFDDWLMIVVQKRARQGSERAQAMLALAIKESENETV